MAGKNVIVFILVSFLICCKGLNFSQEISSELFGTTIDFGDPEFTFATTRSFNGDGYSLDILSVSPENKDRLKGLFSGKMREYPRKPDVRERWKATHWRPTPAKVSEKMFIDFAGNNYDLENQKLEYYLQVFTTELARRGNYYAYFYFLHNSGRNMNVGNVDFFLYSPSRSLLFIINHNT